MTPEEQQMLNDLANKIAQAPAPAIDPEADQLIKTKIGSRPDALYVLTQTVLIQNMAIEHAQQQIQELQKHVAQNPAPQPGSSFLPQSRPWTVPGYSAPPPPPPPAVPGYSTPPPAYATPPPGYATPPPAYATPQPAPPPGGGHSFLRTAAITAGGVAAGALAFEGIKSLFGGGGYSHPQSGFLGGGGAGMIPGLGPGMAPSETIVNNYYDSPQHGGRDIDDSPRSLRDDDDSPRSLRDDDDRVSLDDDRSSADDDSSSLDDSSDSGDSSSGDDFA
jgi:hypothetical protein